MFQDGSHLFQIQISHWAHILKTFSSFCIFGGQKRLLSLLITGKCMNGKPESGLLLTHDTKMMMYAFFFFFFFFFFYNRKWFQEKTKQKKNCRRIRGNSSQSRLWYYLSKQVANGTGRQSHYRFVFGPRTYVMLPNILFFLSDICGIF